MALCCAGESVISGIYLKGPDWGALRAEKRYIQGALYPERKTHIALMGFARGIEGKER